jgi:hypothetical protein
MRRGPRKGFAVRIRPRYRSPSFQTPPKPDMPDQPQQPPIDATNLRTSYANVCRIAQTPNEVIIDFGVNPNFFGQILDEPLKLDSRVILSHDAAKRLCIHLTATIQNYEARYGTIELDVAKRQKGDASI